MKQSILQINGHVISTVGSQLSVDGKVIDVKLKYSLLGNSISMINNIVKIGRNKIEVYKDYFIVNGKKIELSNLEGNENVTSNAFNVTISTDEKGITITNDF